MSEAKKTLPPGVEEVGKTAEDTSQRAYVGQGPKGIYPFTPEPGIRYVLVHEHPDSWGLESKYGEFERNGYTFVQFANSRKTSAWYSIPQTVYDERKAEEKKQRNVARENARNMAKTNTGNVSTWIQEDKMVKGGALLPTPVVFNG